MIWPIANLIIDQKKKWFLSLLMMIIRIIIIWLIKLFDFSILPQHHHHHHWWTRCKLTILTFFCVSKVDGLFRLEVIDPGILCITLLNCTALHWITFLYSSKFCFLIETCIFHSLFVCHSFSFYLLPGLLLIIITSQRKKWMNE